MTTQNALDIIWESSSGLILNRGYPKRSLKVTFGSTSYRFLGSPLSPFFAARTQLATLTQCGEWNAFMAGLSVGERIFETCVGEEYVFSRGVGCATG